MAKQSRKRPSRSERDSTGCLWGIINMFDFRQPQSPTKLLLDRKCGTSRHFGANYSKDKVSSLSSFEDAEEVTDADEIREDNTSLVKKSVKTLVLEETSEVQPATKIPCKEIEQILPEKKYKDAIQTYKGISDLFNNLKSNGMDPTERSSHNFDLATFMINLYGNNHQYRGNHLEYRGIDNTCNVSKTSDHEKDNHTEELDFELAEKQVMLHKSLVDVADVFLRQKFTDSKPLSGEVQPREFMDALEILNTNKELLLSLLQDPDSLLLKLVRDHKNAQLGELTQSKGIGCSAQHGEFLAPKEPNNQSGYKLFRKKDKSKLEKSLEGSDGSCVDKIVILKPRHATVQNSLITVSPRSSPRSHGSLVFQEDGEKVASHFSLKSFKRRLQKVIGGSRKQRHVISMEGVLHRIPYGSTDSGSPRKDNVQHACSRNGDEKDKPSDNFLISENDRRTNMAAMANRLNRESFDKEAKKHLAQFLDIRDNDGCSQVRRGSKTLGTLLSLPEYEISPTLSPRRDKGLDISPTKENDTSNHLSSLIQDLEETSCSRVNPDDNAGPIDVQPEIIDTGIKEGTHMVEDLNQKGIEPEAEIVSVEECDQVDTNSESDGNVTGGTSEKHIEDELTAYSGRGSAQERAPANPRLSKPCSSLLKQMFKDPESILGVSEQPSPISVLEPLFSEDFSNSGCELDQSPVRPQSIHLQEPATPDEPRTSSASEADPQTCISDNAGIVRFVQVVLELAGLNHKDISHRWNSPDQLLDPSLCDQVGILDSGLSDDPKLLFDCTSEALEQIQDSWSPCASLVKKIVRPIPMGENLIHEVCKVIERNRQWQSPRTLDQIVKKDLDGQNWMVVWSDTESVTVEIENAIVEELIEETVHEMWV